MTIKNYYADLLFNYSIARATEQIDPGLQTGLGEPKFNLGYAIYSLKLETDFRLTEDAVHSDSLKINKLMD